MSFQNEVIEFIKSCHLGRIETSDNSIVLVDKGLRYDLVALPRSVEEEQIWDAAKYDGISIWEDQWHSKSQIIRSRILSNIWKAERIYGRETSVAKLNQPEADSFLNENHLIASTNAWLKFGLRYKGEIVAVATFSKAMPIIRNGISYQSFEMIRYCTKNGYTVVGGLSKLINHFISIASPDDIMTYIDLEWSRGRSFEQLGFNIKEQTPPQEFWINPLEMIRYYPHRLPTGLSNDPNELHRKNYFKIHNSGNLKLIRLLK